MISRRSLLTGSLATAAYWLGDGGVLPTRAEQKEVRQAAEAVMGANGDQARVKAYLKSNPVGFDRLWLQRPTGEEIIAIYRDYRLGLAVVPQQCLMLSYFWRDVNDRNVAVTINLGLFDLLSRTQNALSTMAGAPVPLVLTSGYRTPEHNARIEGAAVASEHLYGRASDLVVPGFAPGIVANTGGILGAGGVGVYSRFTHLDVGGTGRRWKG